MEDFFRGHLEDFKEARTVKEFLWKVGELLPEKEGSILGTCYRKKIPIFCPAISDSGIGLMVWNLLVSGKEMNVKEFYDLKEMLDIAWTCKKAGVFYVGGGTPKNYIQQAMQFSKGARYGIQVTMDRAEPGGSSGAPLREGISWGKMKKDGDFVDVICDATIALPLIVAGALE
jgi:deoxyhypusine synthase